MKTKIMMIFMIIVSLFIIQNASASVCSYLDSDGDCITGFQEISDAQDLSLGRQINCAYSNCQSTLDVNGDGIVTGVDVILLRDLALPRPVTIDGAPSNINLEFINGNTQLKITVTDSDGTPRSDADVNYVVNEYLIYNGISSTDANGELILDVPLELVYKRVTAKVWFDVDAPKQIPYTENSLAYIPVNQAPILDFLSDVTINEGDLVIIAPTATDLNDDVATFTYSTPLNSNGQWQTDFNSAGTYIITVTASDGFGLTDSKTFTLIVNDVPQSSGSSSGGSSGGGGGSTPECTDEYFECSEWNECTGNKVQTRECKEIKNCKGDYEPNKLQSCTPKTVSKAEITPEENTNNEVKETEQKNNNQITGAGVYENPTLKLKVLSFFRNIWSWILSLF